MSVLRAKVDAGLGYERRESAFYHRLRGVLSAVCGSGRMRGGRDFVLGRAERMMGTSGDDDRSDCFVGLHRLDDGGRLDGFD